MSTNAALLVVGGGADEPVDVGAGTEVPSTTDVGGGVFVVTVVRGGGTTDGSAGLDVDVDTIVGELGCTVSSVSTGVPDDAGADADESPPSLHPPTATASSATSATLDREIIRSIMSSWVTKVPAMRDNGTRSAIANFHPPHKLRFNINGTGPQ